MLFGNDRPLAAGFGHLSIVHPRFRNSRPSPTSSQVVPRETISNQRSFGGNETNPTPRRGSILSQRLPDISKSRVRKNHEAIGTRRYQWSRRRDLNTASVNYDLTALPLSYTGISHTLVCRFGELQLLFLMVL